MPEEYNLNLIHATAYRVAARRRILDPGCNAGYGAASTALERASDLLALCKR